LQEAIKADLQLTDPADVKGIDMTMKKSFQKIRDEAVHVDKPESKKYVNKQPEGSFLNAVHFSRQLRS
jgi:hypothetical protein